jgi:acyl carrier protein
MVQIQKSLPPLRGVIHAAGVLYDGSLLHQNWDGFCRVMAPKVYGAWNLHKVTESYSLDFFVLFSSAASLLGAPGEGNHAAANAFLDGLAYYRRALGLPALSINWGAWSEIGSVERYHAGERIIEQGMDTFSPVQGLKILERLLGQNAIQVGVMSVRWENFILHFGGTGEALFLSDLIKKTKKDKKTAQNKDEHSDFLNRLENSDSNKRAEILRDCIREKVIKVLGLESAKDIEDSQPLNEAGLDSLMAVELRNLLGTSLNLKRSLPATLVFDYPTISALAGYLTREVFAWDKSDGHAQQKDENGSFSNMGLDDIEQLSDEEVDMLFREKMTRGY